MATVDFNNIVIHNALPRTDRHYVGGTLSVGGVPVEGGVVYVINRDTMALLGVTLSDASGNWKSDGVPELGLESLIVLALGEPGTNAMVFDKISQTVKP